MKALSAILLQLVLLAGCCRPQVTGRVTCDGRGVPGAVVSDGINVAVTNRRGGYRLESGKENGYVFLSIPSGYEAGKTGIIPDFFRRVGSGRVEKADFVLDRVDQSRFHIVACSDIHLTGDAVDKDIPEFRSTFLPDIINTVNSLDGPVYGVCLGDMTTDSKWYVNNFSFPEYLDEMSNLPCPMFHIMGNHDNDRECEGDFLEWEIRAEDRYRREIGPDYYSFNAGRWHFLMLDTIITTGPKKDGNPADTYVGNYGFTYAIDSLQMAWIAKDLALVPKDMGIVVSMHVPYFTVSGLDGGNVKFRYSASGKHSPDSLLDLLSGYREVQFWGGHHHRSQVFEVSPGMLQHVFPSASAVSWKINDLGGPMLCDDGTPAGYKVFTFEGDSLSWVYKSDYRPVEECQCAMYDLGAIPEEYGGRPGTNEVLVNVFDWDPEWKVEVLCDGVPVGIEQIYGYDPGYLSARKRTRALLHRPGSFRETLTVHLFRCWRPGPDSFVEVVLTDRFGRKFRKTGFDEVK